MGLVLLHENFADQAILSGGSWLSTLPLSNMQNADISSVARSSGALNSSTLFIIDLGKARPVGGIAFGPANLSPGAFWRVTAYDDAFTVGVFSSGMQETSGEVIDWSDTDAFLEWEDPGFWLGLSDFETLEELPQFNYFIVPEGSAGAASARIWTLEIFDVNNADGHIDIGRLFMGRAFRPSINYSEDNSITYVPLTDVEESLGGLRTYWERGLRRAFRCAFRNLEEDELFEEMYTIMLRSSISRQVFLVMDEDETGHRNRRSFLATFKQIPALQQLLVERGSTAFDLEEVL